MCKTALYIYIPLFWHIQKIFWNTGKCQDFTDSVSLHRIRKPLDMKNSSTNNKPNNSCSTKHLFQAIHSQNLKTLPQVCPFLTCLCLSTKWKGKEKILTWYCVCLILANNYYNKVFSQNVGDITQNAFFLVLLTSPAPT